MVFLEMPEYEAESPTIIRIRKILDNITVGNYQLWLCETGMSGLYIQIRFEDKDNFGDEVSTQYCREWTIKRGISETELVRTVYKAFEAAVLHEMQEQFLYEGEAIFNPHRNVRDLLGNAKVNQS